jgi:CheY-like chemotaxis protein
MMPNARKKILVVDDSATSLMMVCRILNNRPYDVVTAQDGEEAVRRATTDRPDLILMDVVMPKLNGFEACQRIRQNEHTKAIPIILVTTRGEAKSVEVGFNCGCNDYVTKPVNSLELLSKLSSFLGSGAEPVRT